MIEPWRHKVLFFRDPFTLLSVGSTIGGTILSAVGGIQSSKAQAAALEEQAKQAERAAQEKRAQASLEVSERLRQQKALLSDQQAAAAASGGGATDPSVLDLAGEVGAYGYQQRQTVNANGENQARGYLDEAKARRREAKSALAAGPLNAFSTILSGASSAGRAYYDLMPK